MQLSAWEEGVCYARRNLPCDTPSRHLDNESEFRAGYDAYQRGAAAAIQEAAEQEAFIARLNGR